MNDIPWFGWLALALVVIFVVGLNLMLVRAWRGKKSAPKKNSDTMYHRLAQAVRHPWQVEDDMLAELSRRTAELRDRPDSSRGPNDDSKS